MDGPPAAVAVVYCLALRGPGHLSGSANKHWPSCAEMDTGPPSLSKPYTSVCCLVTEIPTFPLFVASPVILKSFVPNIKKEVTKSEQITAAFS